MVEIPTIFYKRCIDSHGADYNKLLNFCKAEKWGKDFEGTEYAFILDEIQEAVIWIIRRAKYYTSVDETYMSGLGNENYKCVKEDIGKSKIKVLKGLTRKEICDYFMYYVIDKDEEKEAIAEEPESKSICYFDLKRADRETADVINNIFEELKYNMADYFYHSAEQNGWVDSRVKKRIFGILGIPYEEPEQGAGQISERNMFKRVLERLSNRNKFRQVGFSGGM